MCFPLAIRIRTVVAALLVLNTVLVTVCGAKVEAEDCIPEDEDETDGLDDNPIADHHRTVRRFGVRSRETLEDENEDYDSGADDEDNRPAQPKRPRCAPKAKPRALTPTASAVRPDKQPAFTTTDVSTIITTTETTTDTASADTTTTETTTTTPEPITITTTTTEATTTTTPPPMPPLEPPSVPAPPTKRIKSYAAIDFDDITTTTTPTTTTTEEIVTTTKPTTTEPPETTTEEEEITTTKKKKAKTKATTTTTEPPEETTTEEMITTEEEIIIDTEAPETTEETETTTSTGTGGTTKKGSKWDQLKDKLKKTNGTTRKPFVGFAGDASANRLQAMLVKLRETVARAKSSAVMGVAVRSKLHATNQKLNALLRSRVEKDRKQPISPTHTATNLITLANHTLQMAVDLALGEKVKEAKAAKAKPTAAPTDPKAKAKAEKEAKDRETAAALFVKQVLAGVNDTTPALAAIGRVVDQKNANVTHADWAVKTHRLWTDLRRLLKDLPADQKAGPLFDECFKAMKVLVKKLEPFAGDNKVVKETLVKLADEMKGWP